MELVSTLSCVQGLLVGVSDGCLQQFRSKTSKQEEITQCGMSTDEMKILKLITSVKVFSQAGITKDNERRGLTTWKVTDLIS